MDRAQQVAKSSDLMAALRDALAQERPVVIKAIELFAAEMYRMGLMEAGAAQGAHENSANDMQIEDDHCDLRFRTDLRRRLRRTFP